MTTMNISPEEKKWLFNLLPCRNSSQRLFHNGSPNEFKYATADKPSLLFLCRPEFTNGIYGLFIKDEIKSSTMN
jgi:hypothetical protein